MSSLFFFSFCLRRGGGGEVLNTCIYSLFYFIYFYFIFHYKASGFDLEEFPYLYLLVWNLMTRLLSFMGTRTGASVFNSTPPPPTQYLCRQIHDLIALMKSRIILPNFKVLRPCAVLRRGKGWGSCNHVHGRGWLEAQAHL